MSPTSDNLELLNGLLAVHSAILLVDSNCQIIPQHSKFSTFGIDLKSLTDFGLKNLMLNRLKLNITDNEEDPWNSFFQLGTYTLKQFHIMSEMFPAEVFINVQDTASHYRLRYSAMGKDNKIEKVWILFERIVNSNVQDPDYERFVSIKNNSPDILVQCKTDITKFFDELLENLIQKDAQSLKANLHSLKGCFRVLSISSLATDVHNLETQNAKNLDWADVRVKVDQLQKNWALYENLIMIFVVSEEKIDNLRKDQERKDLIDSFGVFKDNLKEWWALSESKEFTEFERKLRLFLLEPLQRVEETLKQDVRSVALKTGKGVRLIFKINPSIRFGHDDLKDIKTMIMHMMVNSVTHGIEEAEIRMEKGLNPEGTIKLTATRTMNYVTLIVEDDGIGFQKAKILPVLLKQNLIPSIEEGEKLGTDAMMKLLMDAHVSTAEKLSEYSGRGVGLSAVKIIADKFKAEIVFRESLLGGACFQVIFPPTLNKE